MTDEEDDKDKVEKNTGSGSFGMMPESPAQYQDGHDVGM
jgi:hypothetical protein